ncbi:TonB-dependent receptor [Sphingomonas sp. C8-2]|nr:TonB-dependent receptor [Sphingomonas sp. C8-2]
MVIGPVPTLANVPRSRVRGFDLDLSWRPSPLVTLSGSLNHSDSRIKSHLLLPNFANVVEDVHGRQFSYAPRWSGTGDVQVDIPINPDLTGFVGGAGLYNSSTNAQLTGGRPPRIKSYATLDLRAGIKAANARWQTSLWGRNVTNAYYWTNVNTVGDAVTRMTGRPATYGVRVDWSF